MRSKFILTLFLLAAATNLSFKEATQNKETEYIFGSALLKDGSGMVYTPIYKIQTSTIQGGSNAMLSLKNKLFNHFVGTMNKKVYATYAYRYSSYDEADDDKEKKVAQDRRKSMEIYHTQTLSFSYYQED